MAEELAIFDIDATLADISERVYHRGWKRVKFYSSSKTAAG